jgi:hypothetical protein
VEKVGNQSFVHLQPEKKGVYQLTGLYYYEKKVNADTTYGRVFIYEKTFHVK